MSHIILETENLSKTFSNSGVQQHVLKNLNVKIKKGDFTVIMGSSGGGKSTLLYALSGMDNPTLGKILYRSGETAVDIAKYSQDQLSVFRRNHCGFVFQQIYLVDTMSVFDNVIISGMLVNKNKRDVIKQTEEILTAVGLDRKLWGKFPNQLSGGEAQRAGAARAVINRPEILFADEPTGALNSHNASLMLDVFTEMNEKGQSIVMVTHDIKSAVRGNRVLYLKDGVIEGECDLRQYDPMEPQRKGRLKGFLEEMGW